MDSCADDDDPRAAYISLLKPSALKRRCAQVHLVALVVTRASCSLISTVQRAFCLQGAQAGNTDEQLDECADAPSPLLAYLRLLLPA